MSRPGSRATSRPPSRPGSRSRHQASDLSVNIKDCEALIRHGVVGLPGGLTKSGNPIILFPNTYKFNEVLETDLKLVLKYYVSIIPSYHDQVRQVPAGTIGLELDFWEAHSNRLLTPMQCSISKMINYGRRGHKSCLLLN